jgi:hypothetical protein
MRIHDTSVTRLVERIGEHYRANISNRFIRPALLQLSFDRQSWDLMEDLTEKPPSQVIHLDELYREIVATANFISVVRRELPSIRSRVMRTDFASHEKVLREMAINNFASNLQLFSDLVNELYIKLVDADKASAKGRAPLYTKMVELANIGRLLVDG